MPSLYVNGEYCSESSAKISVFDRSYLFGEGLFESFRSYNGEIPFLDRHLQRLEWSATFLDISFPEDVDFALICKNLLKKNDLENARFKIVLSKNEDFASDQGSQTNVIIFCRPLDLQNQSSLYKLKVVKSPLNDSLPLVSLKLTNYFTKVYARKLALEQKCDDAILLNSKGNVTEATSGNLFWVDKDYKLHTILESEGFLGGITQKVLLELIQEKKLPIHFSKISGSEITHCREVFLTNSVVGIKPVGMIDNRKISGEEIGSVTAMLQALYTSHIKELIKYKG